MFFILKCCINVKVNIHSFGIPLLISPTQIVCYMDLMFIKLHTVNINRENNWKFYMLSIYLKNLFFIYIYISLFTGMLTITDFINILHRYYKSPMVSMMLSYTFIICHTV